MDFWFYVIISNSDFVVYLGDPSVMGREILTGSTFPSSNYIKTKNWPAISLDVAYLIEKCKIPKKKIFDFGMEFL